MEITEKVYFKTREKWRKWLEKNHNKKKEIWLVRYKVKTKIPCISYDDSVEEALCFGWIDSTVKRIDDEKYIQRFTPRNRKSIWSDLNVKRAEKMIKLGKMTEPGLKLFKNMKPEERIDERLLKLPEELKKALKKNKKAWENYQKFAPSYKKLYKWFIISAKQEATKNKRIKKAVKNAEQNKKYPFI